MTFILYVITYMIEAWIFYYYCSNLFCSKTKKSYQILGLVPLYLLGILIFSKQNIFGNTCATLIINFLYLYTFFKVKCYTAVFHSAIITTIIGMTEMIVVNILPNIPSNLYRQDYLLRTISLTVSSKFLYFICVCFIVHYKKSETKHKEPLRRSYLLFVIPVITSWNIITIAILYKTLELAPAIKFLLAISSVTLLILTFLVFYIDQYNQYREREYLALQLSLQKEADTSSYYQLLAKENETKRILIHDIKNHLNSIALLNEQKEYEKLTLYIQDMVATAFPASVHICDLDLLNAILSRYTKNANEKEISLTPNIRSNCLAFLSDHDLTTLFCNLLDNALEATPSKGFIRLTASIQPNTPFTIITLENTCMENPFNKHGILITKKTDTTQHGYGMKSIKRVVDSYHGTLTTYYKEETHTFHTILMLQHNFHHF